MRWNIAWALAILLIGGLARGGEPSVTVGSETRQNNLASVLLEVSSISGSSQTFLFNRPREGWIFVSAKLAGGGKAWVVVDDETRENAAIAPAAAAGGGGAAEAMRRVAAGEHRVRVECEGGARVERLTVKSIPELMHCGLGFESSIKGYGLFDMEFLKKDILPNVTTLLVPSNIQLPQETIDGWHRQGKKFVAEVGLNGRGKTAEEDFAYYTGIFEKAPFLDGVIINEFGMNRAEGPPNPERQKRAAARHLPYEEAFRKMRADERYKDKAIYCYFGGSANLVNYDDTGKTFVRTLIDVKYPVALERYIFERSSEQGSKDALQKFIDGIADWEANEPGVKPQMVVAFGLFSNPPGGINKLPNVDYHVWMDQQMHIVANDPVMVDLAGFNWWTTILADEETTRFVGKLYRHYALEGKTEMLTRDPLFMTHVQNADFQNGLEGWTLAPAAEESIAQKTFPRYGRIEGRYMGLGRPPDPEHLGDGFLWMKRNEKGPNTFSQTIKDLEPGRLYSMKMFSCDYQDLANSKTKTQEEATGFLGKVTLDGVEIDEKRSFREMYSSNPEPKIPVWITYHWTVFRATAPTAKLTVSDWPDDAKPTAAFGQEQTFNFIEIQPYHE